MGLQMQVDAPRRGRQTPCADQIQTFVAHP
jgi:hypothetical protein